MDNANTNDNVVSRYVFKDKRLIASALTHSSYTYETSVRDKSPVSEPNNERLEFLGDAVLELAISEHIFNTYPELSEGEMTKLRASIVCESTLSEAARRLNMGSLLRIGRGEERTGGRNRGSILADCFEAVAGAVFVDGGYEQAKAFIMDNLSSFIKSSRESFMTADYKTTLQEVTQKYSREPIEYTVVSEDGPAHDKTFTVRLTHAGRTLATGCGKSKKEAEQSCAKQALIYLKDRENNP